MRPSILPSFMSSVPLTERPRERCLRTGAQSLSLRECLAVILGTGPIQVGCMGLASRILEQPGEGLSDFDTERAFFSSMEACGADFLKSVPGLGPVGQARILAAFEMGKRYFQHRSARSPKELKYIGDRVLPHYAHEALAKIPSRWRMEAREWIGFVPVYRTGEVGDLCLVERGVRTHVNFDPSELFARVLSLRPLGFFLAHNHPAGTLTPSWEDQDLTARVNQIAQQLGVSLLGHWIVTPLSQRFFCHRSQ